MSLALPLASAPARWAVAAIGAYQRHLSPWKGFVCAHRVRHGGESCSEYARRVIAAEGLLAGLRALRGRLRECRAAARAIRVERAGRARDRAPVFGPYFDPPPTGLLDKPGGAGESRPKGASTGQASHHLGHFAADCLGNVALDACTPNDACCCGDAAAVDCGGLDLPVLDCGACG